MPELRTETMTVNMGPQHPSTHGVLRLVLELDGETVLSAAPTIGYLHTGIEKTAEQKKWQQVIPLVERMDYLSAQSNSLAFCLSVEKLLGIEVPERVKDIRVLIAELQRIASHLVWLGTHGLEIGAVSVMMYCFREREQLLNLNEMLAGFRMFPSYLRVGGLREDLPRGFHDAVSAFLDRFPAKLDEYEDLLTKNEIYRKRTQGVGRIAADQALAYGLVGPLFLYVGRIVESKGCRELFDLWQRWLVDHPRGWSEGGDAGSIRYRADQIRERFVDAASGAARPALLFVGRFLAFKRVPLLVRAYARARPRLASPARLRSRKSSNCACNSPSCWALPRAPSTASRRDIRTSAWRCSPGSVRHWTPRSWPSARAPLTCGSSARPSSRATSR